MINAYEILLIATNSDLNAVKNAYYQLSKIYHPDGTNPDLDKWQAIENSYRILSNPHLKQQHDFYWKIKSPSTNDEQLSVLQNKTLPIIISEPLVLNYEVDFLDYWNGKVITLTYWRRKICQNEQCRFGFEAKLSCDHCQGLGYDFKIEKPKPCQTCQASGWITNLDHRCQNQIEQKQVQLDLWPGGLKNLNLEFVNQGHQNRDQSYSSLIVKINVIADLNWKIKNNYCIRQLKIPVSFYYHLKTLEILSPWKEQLKIDLSQIKDSHQQILIKAKKQIRKKWSDFDLDQVQSQPFCFWLKMKWIFNPINAFNNDYHHYLEQMLVELKLNDKG